MAENKLPSYEELFGNLDYSSADEYRSVLSPAAYLTDIMDLKNWKYDTYNKDEIDAVDDRRDDISNIVLNAENTITEIPHLDIVNQIMENRIMKCNGDTDPYTSLQKATFPFNLPFNRYKTEIMYILEYFKTKSLKFYKLFTSSINTKIEAREYLSLAYEEEFQLITTTIKSEDDLREYYGLKDDETAQNLSSIKQFRKATELSALQVNDLLFQNLNDNEKNTGVSQKFFINNSPNTTGYLVIENRESDQTLFIRTTSADGTIIDIIPPLDYFDRINRFIRLARKVELSFTELDLILMKGCNGILDENALQIISVIKWLQNTFEIPIEEICTFFSSIKDYGRGDTTIPQDLFDQIFNNGYDEKINTLTGTELKSRIQSCLGCTELEYTAIESYLHKNNKTPKNIEPTVSRLTILYRLKKLTTIFAIPIESLFTLFRLIDKNYKLIESVKFPIPVGFKQTIDNCWDIVTLEEISGPDAVKNIKNALWLIQLSTIIIQWLNENEMSIEQLEFICTEHSSSTVDGVLTSEETENLFRDLDGQFRTVLFRSEMLMSGITDKLTANALYDKFFDIETGVCIAQGIIRRTTTTDQLLPLYLSVIREKLFIETDNLVKTGLSIDELNELFLIMKNRNYLDMDGFVNDDTNTLSFFTDSIHVQNFLPQIFSSSAAIIFKEISERVKNYLKSKNAAVSECTTIAEKISVQATRQQSVLFQALENGLNTTIDNVKILCNTLFRTSDEKNEMAVVRFMMPIMNAFDRELHTGKVVFDASLITSFRRLLQFNLLVSKTNLKARELEVLFFVKDVQNSLPEKLKLPSPFNKKIDALYNDDDNNIYIFCNDQYIRFSGKNYAFDITGKLSDLTHLPVSFYSQINAAIRLCDSKGDKSNTYFFSGDTFSSTITPKPEPTINYWGKVRNHIVEQNRVDAAYITTDNKLYLFTDDQYIRYSDISNEYIDEGYPKNILQNWNKENQVQLPFEIRRKIDSIFLDSDGKVYFFSNDKFIDSTDPTNVQKTRERWALVVNNFISDNKVDSVIVKDGKTFMFSGDQYIRYSGKNYLFVDEGYPRKICNNWNNEDIKAVNGEYAKRIDAAFNGIDNQAYLFNSNTYISSANNAEPLPINSKWGKVLNNILLYNRIDAALIKDGKTFLFSGDQYFRYSSSDYTFLDEGYPKKLEKWNLIEGCGIIPDVFNSGISAVLIDKNNSTYFFSGNQYISSKSGAVLGQVKNSWAKVRNTIQANNKIDAAFTAPDGKTYLFSGDQFFRYSSADYTSVDEGYPKKIQGNWGNLPASFCLKIDTAFIFKDDGIDRLYLFCGNYYVRYSNSNYSQIDPGYPKRLDDHPNPEGGWFEPIFHSNSDQHVHDRRIATIFTDQYNGKTRINYFYYDDQNKQRLMKFAYDNNEYKWSDSILVSKLTISPFVTIDAGFNGSNGKVYLFSGINFAEMNGNYKGITTPIQVNTMWGKIINKFQEFNRVDEALSLTNGCFYLFCDTQYVKYSSDSISESANFFVDEGYPKTIANNWKNENSNIQIPSCFKPEGYSILAIPNGLIYCFTEGTFITSSDQQAQSINSIWGKVENNFESFNKVDAAFVYNNKTYLFCGNQCTRYSGDYSNYADEGYPKKIAHLNAEDEISIVTQFPNGIDAIMAGTDGTLYVFAGSKYISSLDPLTSMNINDHFGIVHNTITETALIDAADTTKNGTLYLFSADQYVRYSAGSRTFVDESYPKSIAHWNNFEQNPLPVVVSNGIKACFTDPTTGEQYFFMGNTFFSLSDPSNIIPINLKWGKVKNNLQESGIVDTAFFAPNEKLYLFSQDQYMQYTLDPSTYTTKGFPNVATNFIYVDEGFPKKIAGNWGNLPSNYRTGIDAGFVFDGRTYIFKNEEYLRYSDPACKNIDSIFLEKPNTIVNGMSELPEFRLNDVKTFQQFKTLSKIYNNTDNSIITYLQENKNRDISDIQLNQLSSVTGWQNQEIRFLIQSGALSATNIVDIQVITELKYLFDISHNMGSLPSALKNEAWDKIYTVGDFIALKTASIFLTGQLKSVMGTAWIGLCAELHNKMNLAKRDALLGYLIYKIEKIIDTKKWSIDNPRDLYEYLLIDVEMGEEATASRIQEAIMCMQLFYHRMLMNIEDEDQETVKDVKEKLKKWWIWMKNYRVWEANRKVFLYPENYIRPELRLDKSPEFKELEEALLQGDITSETAENAYLSYLDKYNLVSRLKIAGGYMYQRAITDSNDQSQTALPLNEKKIFMFGYSNTEPKKYYYMTGDVFDSLVKNQNEKKNQTIDWSPWKEIKITIDAEKVYPVFSFNRLFVFWVEVRERDQSSYSSGVGPNQKVTQYDPILYYSFFNLKGEWTNPQKMVDLGEYIDKCSTSTIELFQETNEKKKNNTVRSMLKGAQLYVTNPITSRYYNSEEFIYISYEARYIKDSTTPEFTFEGKLKSNLEFEQGQIDSNILDKLDKNIQFPFDKFGITPTSFSHWKGFCNDSFSAPWFSFNAAGGGFLAKPDIIQDAPIVKSDKNIYNKEWTNLPDSGFTDQRNRKHLFYRDQLNQIVTQYYSIMDENSLSTPVPVTDVWGKRNIFAWYPDEIESAAVNGEKTFIATSNNRYISYTGLKLDITDQSCVDETLNPFSLNQLLPSGATAEQWHRVKEDLGDFLDTLVNAFVYDGDNRLYLVAKPENESSVAVLEYTIPDMTEFWKELASLIPETDVADSLRNWTSAQSASLYTQNGNKRLYITCNDSVFVKDYVAGTNRIFLVAELTHPDFTKLGHISMPPGSVETPWVTVKQNLMEYLTRLVGIGSYVGKIRFIAKKPNNTYEYCIPIAEELFDALAEIINNSISSPKVAAFTKLGSVELFIKGSIKRLYITSEGTAIVLDYTTGFWSVKPMSELIHPDLTFKVSSLNGLIPSEPPVPWSDVAEDFSEYITTVQRSLVWKGVLYLITPKTGGGFEYTAPSALAFWNAVAEKLPSVSSFTAIDSACIVLINEKKHLYLTFNENIVSYNFSSETWSVSTINTVLGIEFDKINGIIQAPDNTIYVFSKRLCADNTKNVFTSAPVASKWGFLPNVITTMIDAAYMDGDGRVYLFTGDKFIRYSKIDNTVIDLGYPKNILDNFGINLNEIKAEFSADIQNVKLDENIRTNTAFIQNLVKRNANDHETKEEKMYLFMDITATITKFIWKWRWKWYGNWRWRWYGLLKFRSKSWWGWWQPEYYIEIQKETVRKSVYLRFSRNNEQYMMDGDYPKLITGNWTNLPGDFNKMITATFEDSEGSGDTKKDTFYVVRSLIENINGTDKIINDYVKYSGTENFPKEICEEIYEIIRLTSNTSEVLSQRLFIDGIDGLLSLETQKIHELPILQKRTDSIDDIIDEEDENKPLTLKDNRKNDIVAYRSEYIRTKPSGETLDFTSVNAQYYWEIFFHAPYLIAQAFNNGQKFTEANTWYEHIFDPTETYDSTKKYWKFLPFHADIENIQSNDVNNEAQFNRYLNDPFDPHAIAGLRQIAYRKAIVMSYIDNLIDWGDMLFRQYTRETINEARMFYVLAYDLLGKKPELLGTRKLSVAQTYKELRKKKYPLNMAIIELENLPNNAVISLKGGDLSPNGSLLDPYGYFYIPENREFTNYWERVEDRLYKIRYSLNIEGVKQRLALFEPPIDVMALVRAVGSGMGLSQALADFNVTIPHYRFAFILGKARELTARLTQFGQSLLSALEKKDAEDLALLRNTHEKAILKLALEIKNAQLQDSEETLNSLRINLKSAKTREAHYNKLIADGLSSYEKSQIRLLVSSQVFTNVSQVLSISSSMGATAPEAGPFAFHFGGHNIHMSLKGVSEAFGALANNLSLAGNLTSILGGHSRREQDWNFQKQLAQCDIESIERQIAGAEIKVKIARLDIETAKVNIKNLESVDTFMKGKFTNLQLYRWMTGKLSALFFQTYQMALDMAKAAQKSFQFELGFKESEVSFISSLYWDSLKKGLLSGETLQVDLDRMDKAYIEKNKRRFEISKTISLQQLDPLAFLNLREKRICEFSLNEELFDYDFPGHYRRQIKTISITFPAVAGPFENINATLTQLSHRTLIEPDKVGVDYLLKFGKDVDQPLSIRADWRTNQQIALSRGVNDAGLFQLNFQDERYLPFEGTGVVSTWRLELNGQENAVDVHTLSDVIIKIEYSALQGGEVFASSVKKLLKPSPTAKIFNLSETFSAEWNGFMENPSAGLKVTVTREMFQSMSTKNKVTGLYMLFSLSKNGIKTIADTSMKLNTSIDIKQATLMNLTNINKELAISSSGSIWKLMPNCNSDQAKELFKPENISNIALVCMYEKKADF